VTLRLVGDLPRKVAAVFCAQSEGSASRLARIASMLSRPKWRSMSACRAWRAAGLGRHGKALKALVHVLCRGQRLGEFAKPVARHMVGGDAGVKRVRRPAALAGEAEIHARLARQARQEIGAADIGEEPDAGLGHGEDQPFGRHPVAAVHRHADAPAHDDAVDQRDVRLGKALDQRVQHVLAAKEPEHLGVLRPAPVIERADVAAGAERLVAAARITTWRTASSPAQRRKVALISSTMDSVSAFNAWGRFSVMTPARPLTSNRISGLLIASRPPPPAPPHKGEGSRRSAEPVPSPLVGEG
jgi:hypothetical protein